MLPLTLLALAYSLAGPRRYDGRGRRGLSRQALVLCAPRPLTPRQLNGRIANASTVDGILQLHAAHGDALDDINLSTCWSRLGRIAKNADRRRLLQDPALLAPLARQTAAALDDWDLFRREELTQLHVWCLWHSLECGQTEGMPSEGLRRRCHAEFTAQQGRPSRLQRHVGAALFRLVGSRPREEVTIPEGYSLDYLVERGARVAVEVDGPSHYAAASATASAAQHRAPSSATLLKRRQLRSFGWRLVSIPYFEWDQLHAAKGSTAELQRRYLAAALDEAVAETVVAGVS
ncbi:hypothetical protein EMIHUDRAFT_460378 [Emiliania huxleyi CCMP1516]|uniref:RAP domain-containing protein n=2 Tax=Emiliania huxleyi TaxID=2903 RepID=A0A0D3KWD5_EMIH1|nr:hypothetical protein EMIHUDRAFT_460378 [Emiliania huxleyi CCMP1516]EOD40070.1 hypothetical protein EMIHUDRAFT_460378 [Emiliania huxleyi CCMP1516]|eukprot:XP_005792499.1 hypothetical protein EMIHUDRAFT_460378 [Emiliania huxleyi CCMP1516]